MPEAFAEVSFPTWSSGRRIQTPMTLRVKQAEYRHDMMTVWLRRESSALHLYRDGLPIQARWGYLPRKTARFVGYVHHVEPTMGRRGTLKVTCVGASYALKQKSNETWINRTPQSVARLLGRRSGLLVITHGGKAAPRRIITQNGVSSWSLLINLAKSEGYTLYCNGAVLYFQPRLYKMTKKWRAAPLFKWQDDEHEIHVFSAREGQNVPGEEQHVERVAYGMTHSGRLVKVTDNAMLPHPLGRRQRTPLLTDFVSMPLLGSLAAGRARLIAIRDANRFFIRGSARLTGDPRINQADPICFEGLRDKYNGYWFVSEVEHVVRNSGYTMTVEVGRDADGDTGERPAPRPIIALPNPGDPTYGIPNIDPPPYYDHEQSLWLPSWDAERHTQRGENDVC